MCQISHCYRFFVLFLLCALIASLAETPSSEIEKGKHCQIAAIKHLEKCVVVESRETCRFVCDLLIKRIIALVTVSSSDEVQHLHPCYQPFLIDRSYNHCNIAILASKHHPPTA